VKEEDQDVQGAMEHHPEEEATREREEELKAEFPSFFFDPFESWG
jgi:hypothetical protein